MVSESRFISKQYPVEEFINFQITSIDKILFDQYNNFYEVLNAMKCDMNKL